MAVAGRYDIRGIPTIGLFEDGKLTKQAVGARPRHAIERNERSHDPRGSLVGTDSRVSSRQ